MLDKNTVKSAPHQLKFINDGDNFPSLSGTCEWAPRVKSAACIGYTSLYYLTEREDEAIITCSAD